MLQILQFMSKQDPSFQAGTCFFFIAIVAIPAYIIAKVKR